MAQKCSEPGFLVSNCVLWDDEDALNRNYNYNYYTDLWGGLPISSSAPTTARTSAEDSRPKAVAASEAVESDYGRVNTNNNNTVSADTQLSCETAATSSSGGSMSSPSNKVIRSGKNKVLLGTKDIECQSQKAREDSGENFKQCSTGTSSSKRSRAAEVHNLSEKRRRNRINEKMKALQNLIPNSNKTDKASMLDEAIEYLKKLQLQVQMLSARSGIDLSSMRWLAQMPHLQIQQQMPKACMAIDQHAGVPISMPVGSGLINTNQGSEKRPLPLHDLYNSGALGNTAIPINLSSARIGDHHVCKMDHPQGHFTLPQLETTTQEVHSALSLQEK